MRFKLFIQGEEDVTKWPQVTLDHITPSLTAHHIDYSEGTCGDDIEVHFHHFTPDHARQLIEMLTPIAAVVEHKLQVEAEGRHVRFKCSCNLLGLLRDTQGEALEDFKTHVAEKAVTA